MFLRICKEAFRFAHPLAVPDDSATAVPRLSTAAPSSSSLNHPQDALDDDAQNWRATNCATPRKIKFFAKNIIQKNPRFVKGK